ncbi:hypothetical protein DNTS_001692 [Danionella cerebrum]|uniref:Uncharacterized protein n=1 Tax=Danionella cerebrum TaxID=2873325 RepID=A0A553QJ63_9TELE|nr:hypothetical protein DNTS_001692 [Danionella translucida]
MGMQCSLLMTLTMFLLLAVVLPTESSNVTSPSQEIFNKTTSAAPQTTCPQTVPCLNTVQQSPQPVVALLKVKGKSLCEGQLYVDCPTHGEQPLCSSSHLPPGWPNILCKTMRCGDFKSLKVNPAAGRLVLMSNRTLELAAYKAVTGLLVLFILGVFLAKYFRPSYKAFRKRFSQKRQSRWIGPTQSQSVSYHRGQGAPNNNTVKRQSYPGLERLTVNTSREPSSNRNSDYDSYGCN